MDASQLGRMEYIIVVLFCSPTPFPPQVSKPKNASQKQTFTQNPNPKPVALVYGEVIEILDIYPLISLDMVSEVPLKMLRSL